MKDKPRMTSLYVASVLLGTGLLGGCANTDPDFARKVVAIPVALGEVLVEGAAQYQVDQSSRQYNESHPVSSFDDFDRRFGQSSSDPLAVAPRSVTQGH